MNIQIDLPKFKSLAGIQTLKIAGVIMALERWPVLGIAAESYASMNKSLRARLAKIGASTDENQREMTALLRDWLRFEYELQAFGQAVFTLNLTAERATGAPMLVDSAQFLYMTEKILDRIFSALESAEKPLYQGRRFGGGPRRS